jgi:hypothetical protein
MRAIIYRSRRPLQLLIILSLAVLVSTLIWKLFILKNKDIAADYQYLAMISPDQVIQYQKNKPESWKDYIAVITACNRNDIREDVQKKTSLSIR